MSRKKAIQDHYESRIAPRRADYDILDWADPASQQLRFQVLADNVPLAGKSLLDVGCGLGGLWSYLKDRGIGVDYTGVDITEKIVVLARRRRPGGRFKCANLFAEDRFGKKTFDVVFCSGVFNLDLGNNREFLPVALARLFELSRGFVVFNLLHCRAPRKYPRYVYYDPAEVMATVRELPCRARLIDDYLPNDFTVVCDLGAGGPASPETAAGSNDS